MQRRSCLIPRALLEAGYAVLGVQRARDGLLRGEVRSPQFRGRARTGRRWSSGRRARPGRPGTSACSGIRSLPSRRPGVAALHPAGLDAIAPFQLADDIYRDVAYTGGIPNGEFGVFSGVWPISPPPLHISVGQGNPRRATPQCCAERGPSGDGQPTDNIFVAGLQHPFVDSYWNSKTVGAAAAQDQGAGVRLRNVAGRRDRQPQSPGRCGPGWIPSGPGWWAANGYHSQCIFSNAHHQSAGGLLRSVRQGQAERLREDPPHADLARHDGRHRRRAGVGHHRFELAACHQDQAALPRYGCARHD